MARPKKEPKEVLENLTCRVPPEIAAEVSVIAEKLDRSVSYISRKLVIRGLIAYKRDGLLDESAETSEMKAGKKQNRVVGMLAQKRALTDPTFLPGDDVRFIGEEWVEVEVDQQVEEEELPIAKVKKRPAK